MIRVDEIWLAVDPLDMRAGFDTALGRVVKVFGAAHPHHAYLFTNRRANRLKVVWGLTIVGKGQRERTVPVSAATLNALRAHWRSGSRF
ncbi:IS66 family insertion sequence element accessory protein TnpB [Caballeronia sp. GaOx3]|uniref:IS66 family insertion sequence element accessory protein TnpB n=1 Tax=Caballeronia sp. GaOx3 TaxID=2921740 RepID=UPI0020293218|nr:IS66 family insertion sequence element accessory protein TnpB [Caballeronia sp. GaOx3]